MEERIAVHFFGKTMRLNRHNLLPIYLRVTINGKRFEVATHQHVAPGEWIEESERVKGKSDTAIQTNISLDEIKKRVYDHRDTIRKEQRDFTVNTLREKWFGQDRNCRTLLEAVKITILDLERQVSKGVYKKSTVTKYYTTEKHLVDFLKWRNLGNDVLLVDLRLPFAGHFVYYLQGVKGLGVNSSAKMVKKLKKIVRDCVDKEWLDTDPFFRYHVKHIDPKIPHLSADELLAITSKVISVQRLALVRDLFIFSCYTGFAYIDVATLTAENLKIGIDGTQWLIKNRQKTDISERVPVLPPVASILEKYKDFQSHSQDDKLLPIPSNQKVNAYLKEIAVLCDIKTKLTFHIARHTFATTVSLENGVPIDSVSKMLGHRSIKTTQIYAKVTDKKISDDVQILRERLSPD